MKSKFFNALLCTSIVSATVSTGLLTSYYFGSNNYSVKMKVDSYGNTNDFGLDYLQENVELENQGLSPSCIFSYTKSVLNFSLFQYYKNSDELVTWSDIYNHINTVSYWFTTDNESSFQTLNFSDGDTGFYYYEFDQETHILERITVTNKNIINDFNDFIEAKWFTNAYSQSLCHQIFAYLFLSIFGTSLLGMGIVYATKKQK